jgi:ABC-type glycerol-3-phosphate transport system substrate-binding protein
LNKKISSCIIAGALTLGVVGASSVPAFSDSENNSITTATAVESAQSLIDAANAKLTELGVEGFSLIKENNETNEVSE